ncbi:MAG: helix-turn-helix domain-containing protein [Actinomycetota bacterium]
MYGGPGTGIGPALRKARETRGKSIEEASRDTRIRPDYLLALEREAFQTLRGDVYVRGFLRSYSSYLGLNPDKVVSVYVRASGRDADDLPGPPPVQPLRQAGLHKLLHRRGNWALAVIIALVGLGAAGAVGLLTRNGSAPPIAATPASAETGATTTGEQTVTLVMTGLEPVHAEVVVDGRHSFSGQLDQGQTKPFEGADVIRIELSQGKSAFLVVNGKQIGAPGEPGHAYAASFNAQDFRRSSGG